MSVQKSVYKLVCNCGIAEVSIVYLADVYITYFSMFVNPMHSEDYSSLSVSHSVILSGTAFPAP